MKQTATYSFNRLSFNYAFPIFVLTAVFVFFSTLYFKNPHVVLLWITIGLGSFLAIIIYLGFFARKIKIHDNHIEFIGVKKHLQIDYKDVRSFGIFIQSQYHGIPIDPENANKYSIWGAKFIYISTIQSPELRNKNSEGYICLQYRKSAYELLVKKLNENVIGS